MCVQSSLLVSLERRLLFIMRNIRIFEGQTLANAWMYCPPLLHLSLVSGVLQTIQLFSVILLYSALMGLP